MQPQQIAEMYAVETDHWWFSGKRLFMRRLLGDRLSGPSLRILDVGCGTGATAVELAACGNIVACDSSLDALRFVRSRAALLTVAAAAPRLPFRDASFDIIVAYDILEHVTDDAAFVRDLARLLAPGGAVAIHVPAWPALWSRHDEVLEHKRRYTRRTLKSLLVENGLRLEALTWASCAIFFPTVAVRWVRASNFQERSEADLGIVPASINRLLRGVYRVEAEIAFRWGLPIGLSLAAIATPGGD